MTRSYHPYAGLTRRIWLLLANEGGRWNTREVAQALGVPDRTVACASLNAMARTGTVTRWETSPLTYGVTAECRVADGVTVGELQAACMGPKGAGHG